MPLHCPFCQSPEQHRVAAEDDSGQQVVLLMFDCPFFFRIATMALDSEEVQLTLDDWRAKHGDKWLESIGPILRERELKNIRRFEERASQDGRLLQ